MVRKVNVFNAVIIILAFALVVTIGLHYYAMEENTLTFSGANIYRSVYIYQIMDEQGFAVLLTIDGRWVDTQEAFQGSGIVVDGEYGQYTMEYYDNYVTVGGPQSAAEDISANEIKLSTLHDSVLKIGLEPASSLSLSGLYSELLVFTDLLVDEEIYNVGISGDVMVDTSTALQPTLVQEIDNLLKPGNEVELFDNGLRIGFENAELSDINAISDLLSGKGIMVSGVATSKLELIVRTKGEISESRDTIEERISGTGYSTYLLRIIKSPII